MRYKGLLQSRTFWGIILTIASPYLAKWGIDNVQVERLVSLILELGFGGYTVYGRIKAKKPIVGLVAPTEPKE